MEREIIITPDDTKTMRKKKVSESIHKCKEYNNLIKREGYKGKIINSILLQIDKLFNVYKAEKIKVEYMFNPETDLVKPRYIPKYPS